MFPPILLRDLADLIGINRSRIDQAISREQFLPNIWSDEGKPREWIFGEAMRLALFFKLTDQVGMNAKTAGILTQIGVHGFEDQRAFFVAYHLGWQDAWGREVVKASDLGKMLTSGCEYTKVLSPGRDAETIVANSKKKLGPAKAAVVIDLDVIEDGLKRGWPREETE